MSVTFSFASLTLAMAALWAPRVAPAPLAARLWMLPFAVALVAAAEGGLVDARGLVALLMLAAACVAANRATSRGASLAAHVLMLAVCAALLLHVVPGFDNPRVLSEVVVGSGGQPYTKYLSFDKGVVGLFLLGLYAPGLPARDEGAARVRAVLLRFAVLAVVMMGLSVALGYVRWDPKLPSWWLLWLWSMVFLTALPEEAIFRGVAQSWVARWLERDVAAAIIVGTLFGIAHLGGGITYVVLAAVAGVGYGWIYATSRSIGAAIAAHAGLNTVHFILFTYPSLTG